MDTKPILKNITNFSNEVISTVEETFLDIINDEIRAGNISARDLKNSQWASLLKKTYSAWANMKMVTRCPQNATYWCLLENNTNFVHPDLERFEDFLKIMGLKPAGCRLVRKNPDLAFTPKNLIWAKKTFRTNSFLIFYRGQLRTLPKVAEMTGIDYSKLYVGLKKKNQSLDEIILEQKGCKR